MTMAIPKVLGCTRQSCSVWKLRVCMHIIAYTHTHIYIYNYMHICIYIYIVIIFCVYIGATLIGNVEVEMILSNNIQQLFKNLDLLTIITPLICLFQ